MGQQLDVIREMIQKKIPDKKIRTIWYITVDIQNNILYGISANNNHFFAIFIFFLKKMLQNMKK